MERYAVRGSPRRLEVSQFDNTVVSNPTRRQECEAGFSLAFLLLNITWIPTTRSKDR